MALYIEKYKPEYFVHVLFNNASRACLWVFFSSLLTQTPII